jgi:hypothetical protein
MTRNPIEIALRGLKNALANWQLVAIRMVEGVVFFVLIFFALLVTIIPTAVEAGLGKLDVRDASSAAETVAQFFVDHHVLILWTVGVLLLVTCAMLVIHAFVVAGSVRVYLEGERAGGDFNVFRSEPFWAAAKAGFWRSFGIYNIAWGLAGLVILVPFMVGFAIVMVVSEPAVALVILGVVVVGTIVLCIPVGVATSIWVNRALVDGEKSGLSARAALAAGRAAIRSDLLTHLVVAFFVLVAGIGGTGLISSLAGAFAGGGVIIGPMHIIGSLAETFAGALASAWMLASFVAVAGK